MYLEILHELLESLLAGEEFPEDFHQIETDSAVVPMIMLRFLDIFPKVLQKDWRVIGFCHLIIPGLIPSSKIDHRNYRCWIITLNNLSV